MQISKVVLYGKEGQTRTVAFRTGRTNVITGRSGRGKSAILAIVDYCLGASRLGVPAGVIQDSVAWYGLELDFSGERMFVARPGVSGDRRASPDFFIGHSQDHETPSLDDLIPTYKRQDLLDKISARLGLTSALIPRADGGVERKGVSFRSGLIYCLQKQNEIANPDLFFHRQGEAGVAQLIRDTLPFYLGAISPRVVEGQAQLRAAKARLRDVERKLTQAASMVGRRDAEAAFLLSEASRLGVSTSSSDSLEAMLAALRSIEVAIPTANGIGSDTLAGLNARLNEIQKERADLRREIEALQAYQQDQQSVEESLNEQRSRLTALDIAGEHTAGNCPICNSVPATRTPTVTELNSALAQLNRELEFVSGDQGDVLEGIANRRASLAELDRLASEIRSEVMRSREEESSTKILLERQNELARLSGMVHMFLRVNEAATPAERISLESERASLLAEIDELESETDIAAVRARTATFLGSIGRTITDWARDQDLEYASGLITFDPRGPTLVSERDDGTVPFSRFGSGRNWVWYHLLGHLALHKWFIENSRPVPRFLFIDQPSQVYFSSAGAVTEDPDWQEVKKIYDWLFAQTSALDGGLQVIVTDHARFFDDPEFAAHLEHDWWDDDALVPLSWL